MSGDSPYLAVESAGVALRTDEGQLGQGEKKRGEEKVRTARFPKGARVDVQNSPGRWSESCSIGSGKWKREQP
jgi:hypothetical protein